MGGWCAAAHRSATRCFAGGWDSECEHLRAHPLRVTLCPIRSLHHDQPASLFSIARKSYCPLPARVPSFFSKPFFFHSCCICASPPKNNSIPLLPSVHTLHHHHYLLTTPHSTRTNGYNGRQTSQASHRLVSNARLEVHITLALRQHSYPTDVKLSIATPHIPALKTVSAYTPHLPRDRCPTIVPHENLQTGSRTTLWRIRQIAHSTHRSPSCAAPTR